MKTILAPTDFSASSLNAVYYAADLALAINAKLVLFHAIHFPIAVSEISLPGDFIDDMLEVADREMKDLYDEIQTRTKGKLVVATDIKIGSVEREIENLSVKERPLAVVMGIRAGKTMERALMGSSVFHIMNYVGFPTLIIPDGVHFTELKTIGIACDLKYANEKIPFETVTEWLYLFKSKIEIINVSGKNRDLKSDQLAESISIQARLKSFNPGFHFLNSDNIAEELNDFTKVHPTDLLMVFPRKHGIFKFFHKSKSKSIVNQASIPILSIHDHQ
ncbi:MAG TPA: universal stress protein [Puia sp.]|jgi:nucleotide-binding universal stress UspA family protein|nr:universal stress protein [Puia sp.]